MHRAWVKHKYNFGETIMHQSHDLEQETNKMLLVVKPSFLDIKPHIFNAYVDSLAYNI